MRERVTECVLKPSPHLVEQAADMGVSIDEAEWLANRGTKRPGRTRLGEPCVIASNQWKEVVYKRPRECMFFGITIYYR